MLKKIIKKESGFTLLELLIVIVIIGILALLIIPNITSAPKKARDTQRKTDLKAVQKGLEEYFTSNTAYPASLAPLADASTGAPIMKAVPTDPKNSSPYVYTYTPGTGSPINSYTLTACLENGGDNSAGTGPASDGGTGCTTRGFKLLNNN